MITLLRRLITRKIEPLTKSELRVLKALVDRPLTGVKLSREVSMGIGSLYPSLALLEKFGYLDSDWVSATLVRAGARARLYKLTEKGKQTLAETSNGRS